MILGESALWYPGDEGVRKREQRVHFGWQKKSSVRTGVLGDTSFRLVLFYLLSDSIGFALGLFLWWGVFQGNLGRITFLMTLMMFRFCFFVIV